MPGMSNTLSVRIAPPSRRGDVEAKHGHERTDRGAHTVLEDHRPLAKALRARGPDVVLAHHLKQAPSNEPG